MRSNRVYGLMTRNFGAVRTIQDVPGNVQALPGPEKVLRSLFTKWKPLGKNSSDADGASPATVRGWLRAMVVASPSRAATETFIDEAEPMGWRLIGLMRRFAINVEILPRAEYLKKRRDTSGYYISRFRTVMVVAEVMGRINHSTVRHEMGHALEHMISSLCLQGHPYSVNLWHGFNPTRKAFVTPYAGTRPAEYFAESVEAYFIPHSRVWLEHNDPGMHAFLTALFELSNM